MLDAVLISLLAIATAGTFAIAVSSRPTVIAVAEAFVEILVPGGLALVVVVCVAATVLGL